jgi:predicted esterase YcpF (UPF0227 family)
MNNNSVMNEPNAMKTLIINIHGFNSTANSNTSRALKAHFGTQVVHSLEYDYINPEIAEKQLDAQIQNLDKLNNDLVLVGNSLGGFWANYFANKYSIQCVLINPSLNPYDSLVKYIGVNKNFHSGELRTLTQENIDSYRKYPVIDRPHLDKIVVIGAMDTTVDYNYTLSVLGKYHQVIIEPTEGHNFENKSIIIKAVSDMMTTLHG